ncbi:ribonuclease H [Senna tora]|uniref:Ribonuclease H n=1 Tax=Senna tora TaxID=362788 RepID=A0A834SN52_9FABA|nr:ribonuclease H [Senna tora]
MHGRQTKQKYSHIIERMQTKLAGWKANCLSLAGRATLVQSVCSTMLLYHMQHAMLPKGVISEIEKLERAFLWGSSPKKKRLHQISWNKICIPRRLGGLGILSLKDMNLAFLFKLVWQLLTYDNALWVRFFKGRYGITDKCLFESKCKASDSRFWKDIVKILPEFRKLVGWEIGDGSVINFWNDQWISKNTTLTSYCDRNDRNISGREKIKEFVNNFGHWDSFKLGKVIPQQVTNNILSLAPPDRLAGVDTPFWIPAWDAIWKSKNKYRDKFLLWRISHNSLPTRSKIASWNSLSSLCSICKTGRELNTHVIRDCPNTSHIWNYFVKPNDRTTFFLLPLKEWVTWNIKKGGMVSNIPWSMLFSIICSRVWDWRNKFINDNEFQYPLEPHKSILIYAKSQMSAFAVLKPVIPSVPVLPILWKKPEVGWVKVNTDGAVCKESKVAGCGGLIRDHDGVWIKGFERKIGFSNVLSAELWGIAEGLSLAWILGYRKVILESDCKDAIRSCTVVNSNEFQELPAVKKIREILRNDWEVQLKYTPRNANSCADFLAKSSLHCNSRLAIIDRIPDLISSVVAREASGSGDPGG